MYQALLTRKYLTSKIMPLLAMAAVTLSVATVLVTWSIMGGFLNALLAGGERVTGDVAILWPNVGFRHYDDLVERLEADERIAAAAPVVETFGLVQLPNGRVIDVYVRGIDPQQMEGVTGYSDSLWWKPVEKRTPKDHDHDDVRVVGPESGDTPAQAAAKSSLRELMETVYQNGLTMTRPDPATGQPIPAAVLGIELTGLNERTAGGVYYPMRYEQASPDGGSRLIDEFLPREGSVGITLLRLNANGEPVDSVNRRLPVANEFATGIYDHDSKTVLLPLGYLQQMLGMDEARRIERAESVWEFETDPDTGERRPKVVETVAVDPARVTTVLVKGVDAYKGEAMTPERVRAVCEGVYAAFAADHAGDVPDISAIRILTWTDIHRTIIEAVKKETGLVLFVFGIVCFTTVFLVLAIFWSMVSEKTKDIGVLRSLGAGTWGVAWLWLRYGIAIGIVGAVAGTIAGWLITTNINAIHEWIGTQFGFLIWDPRVYYFTEIPRKVEPAKAVIVAVSGVATCLVGSLLPAWRAARMDPVKALRFE